METANPCIRLAALFAALLVGGPVVGDDPPISPPDAQFLEFLGELAGEDALFIEYTISREAKRAAKRVEKGRDATVTPTEAAADADDWDTLDAPIQELLAGQADRWATLPRDQQRALADGAKRWLALDGIGRAQANDRWQTWRWLTPDQRERVQKAWARFRELTPEQQLAVRSAYLRFQELPQEQRDGLLERLQQMSPEERRRAMNRRQGAKPGSEDKRPCPPC